LSICQYHSPSAVNKRRQNPKGNIESQPRRKSTRLQEKRDSSQQRIARAGKRTRPSPKTTKTHHYAGREQPQAERRTPRASKRCQLSCNAHVFTMLTSVAKQRSVLGDNNERQPESSPSNLEARKSGSSPSPLSAGDNAVNSRAVERRRTIKEACNFSCTVLRS
jgi:hypothetical protein